jgi:hemerythrin-like metal-binding protein
MELIEFTDDYRTGIETIDYEHQKLFIYLNEIIKALEMGDSGRLLVEINLDELIGYTVFHFNTEEGLMEKCNYEGLEEHKKGHEALKQKAINFKNRFNEGDEIGENLVEFLKTWLVNHIKGTDRKYIALFKECGVV